MIYMNRDADFCLLLRAVAVVLSVVIVVVAAVSTANIRKRDMIKRTMLSSNKNYCYTI